MAETGESHTTKKGLPTQIAANARERMLDKRIIERYTSAKPRLEHPTSSDRALSLLHIAKRMVSYAESEFERMDDDFQNGIGTIPVDNHAKTWQEQISICKVFLRKNSKAKRQHHRLKKGIAKLGCGDRATREKYTHDNRVFDRYQSTHGSEGGLVDDNFVLNKKLFDEQQREVRKVRAFYTEEFVKAQRKYTVLPQIGSSSRH